MSWQSDFYGNVYSTAKELGATDTQAHLAAAQASQETGYGKHVVGNNYFGVKASPSYTGDTVTANTSEGEDGVSNRMDQSFRAYDGLKASVANYMDVMANAFPDAWNATNIAEAAKGLVSGKFGRYAKDLGYPGKIQSIANKLGAQQKYAYAQNPENVPVPYGPEDDPLANSQQAQAIDGMSGLLNPVTTQEVTSSQLPAYEGWTINGVTPALGPTVEGWSAMAAAEPMAAPMGGVTASGLLGSTPGLTASATATPDAGLLSGVPDTSSFDMSRFGPTPTPDTSSFDMSRFGPTPTIDTSSFDQARFGPMSIDPATNTQSFMDAPQTAVATGINSPEHKQIQAMAEAQLAATRAAQPSMSVPASGLLAANPALEASATVPSLQSSFAATPSVTPAEQAINSIATPGMSPQQISGYQQAAQSMAQAGMLNIGQQPPTDLSGNLPANFNVLSAPALESVSVPDQPTIEGPATTEVAPAQEQQQAQQVQQAVTRTAAQPQSISLGDKLKAAVNPGTAIGGLLGGVTMGPVGGLLGGLLGNAVNQGSFSGLLGGPSQPGGFIGSGPAASYGIYGGGYAPGSYAMATDGSRVTSGGGGWTTRTDANGVTSSQSPWGGGAGWFGGDPNDQESYT